MGDFCKVIIYSFPEVATREKTVLKNFVIFKEKVRFYTSWKPQKTRGVFPFTGGIEREHWPKMLNKQK